MRRLPILLISVLLAAGAAGAGEKKLMHCFAFTVIESATEAEWEAFYKATDELPSKIPGLTRVWRGKLRAPLTQVVVPSAEDRKKIAASKEPVDAKVTRLQRQHGVCMEMADEAALKAYAAHPAHKEWVAVYEKVRVAGTTTYDILGQ